jgi:CubicO group peptidase (beta-lactamase class C family)
VIFHGEVAPGFESVRDAFVQGHADDPGAAQLCVYRDGERVIDLWTGREAESGIEIDGDTPTVLWSVTKGLMAIVVAQLVERGELDPEALVTDYWPEYGAGGKESTRVWHLLSHSAGLPLFPLESGIAPADVADHDRLARALAGARPMWTPGTASYYHAFTYGTLVDEVVRRATGRSTAQHFAERVTGPLRVDLWMAGIPAEREHEVTHRHLWNNNPLDVAAEWSSHGVDLTDPVVDRLAHATPTLDEWVEFFNTPAGHSVEFGSAGAIASARAIAAVYAACLPGGLDGVELFGEATRAAVTRSRTSGLGPVPPLAPLPRDREMEFGLGFMIRSPFVDDRFREGGTFGHPGAGGNFGWAHPATRSAVGYTCTSMWADSQVTDTRLPWVRALSDALGA